MGAILDFLAAHAGVIGIIFFFTFFCLVTLWTFRPGAGAVYRKYAQLPLEEENKE
ncbi:MAG: cbb3-type cytochrome c oxidase subunit 3 [Alphaproteobacteria bacterium]|nr:cbb3-type cytochrome c oxidase subunit 3 [Alphaproteobacteria bacterium]